MKFSKRITTSLMTAALAASMTCALPAMASAAPTATGAEASATYCEMGTSTVKKTVKANEKRELIFKLNGKKVKGTKIAWKSKNTKVATVDKKGFATTKKEGKVTITGKYRGHVIYYKLTVKGDAAFDYAVDEMKSAIKKSEDVEHITDNGADVYRVAFEDNGTSGAFAYDAKAKRFEGSAIVNLPELGVPYGIKLSFSEKYTDKNCAIVSTKNGETVKSITMKKSALKSSDLPTLSDNAIDNTFFQALGAGFIDKLASYDDAVTFCKVLGFTSIDK